MGESIVKCSRDDIEYIERELVTYNGKQVPYLQERAFIDLNYKIEDSEQIVAGIRAVLYCWNCLFIDICLLMNDTEIKGMVLLF